MAVESRELLKNTHGVGSTENSDRASEADIFVLAAAAAERITTGAESTDLCGTRGANPKLIARIGRISIP